MSQQALADVLDLSRASIVNIEAGRQHPPVHVLWSIATHLGTDVPSLLPTREEMHQLGEPVHLDDKVIAAIEHAADGDTATRLRLLQFVSNVKNTNNAP
jgi:DNA-binding XRE family transcriptional regulator